MRLTYFVNRVSFHSAPVTAIYQGYEVKAFIEELEVELLDPSGQHGTLTLRFHQADEKAVAVQQFKAGETIELEVSITGAQSAAS